MDKQRGLLTKTLVFGIILLFIGMSINPSTGTVLEEKSSTALGFPGYIQDLIDNASDGDTIHIPSGIYYENIVIDKSISLIGEDKNTTIIDGGGNGDVIYLSVSADYVNISGFTIRNSGYSGYYNWDAGIDIKSNYCNIYGNIISNNGNGIWVNSMVNTINNNTISNNQYGIYLAYVIIVFNYAPSLFNRIDGNTISNNDYGIYLNTSSFNLIIKNNFIDNKEDAFFTESFLNRWKQNYWYESRILPKFIHGEFIIHGYGIPGHFHWIKRYPWIQVDWHPAKEPYDI